jgi:hypothetical protein
VKKTCKDWDLSSTSRSFAFERKIAKQLVVANHGMVEGLSKKMPMSMMWRESKRRRELMGISPISEPRGPRGSQPLAEGQKIARRVFSERAELSPVAEETLLQKLSEPTKAEVQPSYTLAGLAVIRAATAAKKEQ